jgi:phosphatidylglycerol---prolipoprotein diacylglyceryl transferase
MLPVLFRVDGFALPTHDTFVALGILVGAVVFFREAHQRGRLEFPTWVAVTGAMLGAAVGMRLSGWLRYTDLSANPPLWEAWQTGPFSILGGLSGAYVGVLVAKRLIGYRERTGDLFAPAVALGMAIGRIGCFLTEAPGRPTTLPWGIHAPATVPDCPGCVTGQAMHPSFAYEILFQLAMFAVLYWLKPRVGTAGALFTVYVSAYAVFRFLVEFTRANDTVWLGLTRPQWFLIPGLLLVAWRVVTLARRHYAGRSVVARRVHAGGVTA